MTEEKRENTLLFNITVALSVCILLIGIIYPIYQDLQIRESQTSDNSGNPVAVNKTQMVYIPHQNRFVQLKDIPKQKGLEKGGYVFFHEEAENTNRSPASETAKKQS